MVLSNYKCMHIRIQGSWILIQGLQTYSSNVSSNRIKIQEILLILQLETDYSSKLFISEMLHSKQSSQRLPELLFYTKKSYKILQSSNSSSNPTRAHYREFYIELFEYYNPVPEILRIEGKEIF